MELTKKQIDNILEWLGKSYPADITPPDEKSVLAWRHIKHGK